MDRSRGREKGEGAREREVPGVVCQEEPRVELARFKELTPVSLACAIFVVFRVGRLRMGVRSVACVLVCARWRDYLREKGTSSRTARGKSGTRK